MFENCAQAREDVIAYRDTPFEVILTLMSTVDLMLDSSRNSFPATTRFVTMTNPQPEYIDCYALSNCSGRNDCRKAYDLLYD